METTKRGNETKDEALLDYSGLPPEITTDIFLRLPAKSVGRFRSVSKPFRSQFWESGFKKKHLDLALKQDSGHWKVIIPSRDLHSADLDSIGNGSEVTRVLAGVPTYWVEIIGSSNGLVCTYSEKGGNFLYNPTTGESKRIPKSNLPRFVEIVEACRHFGFGFDSVSDDYKVVQFIANDEGFPNLDVYSLKKNAWRRISGLPYKQVGCNPGVPFNGAIHWVVKLRKRRNLKGMVVAAFDLKTDTFRDIPLPDEAVDSECLKAAILKGRLCLVYDSFGKHDVMWVMNEYGVESSWTKIQLSMSYRSMTPLWSAKNNEVLLQLDGKFVLYNFERKACRNLEFNNVTFRKMFVSTTYVESLVSPNSYGNA